MVLLTTVLRECFDYVEFWLNSEPCNHRALGVSKSFFQAVLCIRVIFFFPQIRFKLRPGIQLLKPAVSNLKSMQFLVGFFMFVCYNAQFHELSEDFCIDYNLIFTGNLLKYLIFFTSFVGSIPFFVITLSHFLTLSFFFF